MKVLISACLASVLVVALPATAANHTRNQNGDQLSVPTADSAAARLPDRGLSMSHVAQSWGQPQQRLSAVGDPPITRWVYDGFTVYFEYQSVIHSVPHQRPAAARS